MIHSYIFSNLYTCPQTFYWKEEMDHHHNAASPNGFLKLSFHRMSRKHSQMVSGQHLSRTVFPGKKGKLKSSKLSEASVTGEDAEKIKTLEHKIDRGHEKSDLLGYDVFSGRLSLYTKGKSTSTNESNGSGNVKSHDVGAKLTSKAFIWGSRVLHLADIISVSYNYGYRHFTVHAYPIEKRFYGLSCLFKPNRIQKDLCFLASSSTEAIQWVNGFANLQCYINCLPHPMVSSKQQSSDILSGDPMSDLRYIKCRSQRRVLVILNPRSGHGRSSNVFHDKVEPIFKLAGFKMDVVQTKSAGHARKLARSLDFSTYPDGIICIGGDGLMNEVLNGLLGRENQKEAISIPIGIIPAGSDNSLVWTILGVRDPISAALAIVKGGLTATDVFGVEWIQTGAIHYGTTVSYFGFLSDVLELSERYQKRFGPLRYFVAGFLKFLFLPKYSFDLEYLPISKEEEIFKGNIVENQDKVSMSDFDADMFRRSRTEILHPQTHLTTNLTGIRTKTKLRTDNACSDLTVSNDSKTSAPATSSNDKEDISSTVSDPGPVWDSEPKWDTEPNWEAENPVELPVPSDDLEVGIKKELVPSLEDKWVIKKGQFLGILVCNHSCRTVQSLRSQVVAPKAEHDDSSLDLLVVNGNGKLRLLKFFILLQFGQHLSLPYVNYVKVKAVKVRPGLVTHNGCGIDGELLHVKEQVKCYLLPYRCQLIGRPVINRI